MALSTPWIMLTSASHVILGNIVQVSTLLTILGIVIRDTGVHLVWTELILLVTTPLLVYLAMAPVHTTMHERLAMVVSVHWDTTVQGAQRHHSSVHQERTVHKLNCLSVSPAWRVTIVPAITLSMRADLAQRATTVQTGHHTSTSCPVHLERTMTKQSAQGKKTV